MENLVWGGRGQKQNAKDRQPDICNCNCNLFRLPLNLYRYRISRLVHKYAKHLSQNAS
jgi:hypothetical protein